MFRLTFGIALAAAAGLGRWGTSTNVLPQGPSAAGRGLGPGFRRASRRLAAG